MSKVVSKPYICYDPEAINNLLKKLDEDPAAAPRGIGQIQFYAEFTKVLMDGTPMNISVEEEGDDPVETDVVDEIVYTAEDDDIESM